MTDTSFPLKPLRDTVFVSDLDSGMKMTAGGIIVPDDNMKEHGIRPRWGRVCAVGPEVDDIAVGEWLLIEHGRWTNRIDVPTENGSVGIWKIDYPQAVLLACDEDPRLQNV
jgi:hypothetical protein